MLTLALILLWHYGGAPQLNASSWLRRYSATTKPGITGYNAIQLNGNALGYSLAACFSLDYLQQAGIT